MSQTTSHRRLTDTVARTLRDWIVSGRLVAGSRVEVTAIATELEVSRTPVREALLQLEAAGLVVRQPYRGTVVAGVDPHRLEEVTALRIDLEGRAALLGVPRLSSGDLSRMAAVLDELDASRDDVNFSLGLFNDLNRAFHGILYTAADHSVLVRLIAVLNDEADRLRLHVNVRAPFAEAFHREILDACRRGDAAAAADATRRHLLTSFLEMSGMDQAPTVGLLADVLRDVDIEVAQ